ncbi:MAG: hypothetical protein Q4C89_01490 [Deinococcus sp.]|nr:hypothetical protein [Deinococcus sp.]MDO4244682.1 hypothetical protein [Deinococcus sp.]
MGQKKAQGQKASTGGGEEKTVRECGREGEGQKIGQREKAGEV